MSYVIGVDLGGTQLRAIRIDHTGQVYAYKRTDTAAASGVAAVIAQIKDLIAAVIGDVSYAEIDGIGVGAPGPLDPFEGVVLDAPNLPGWDNVPLRAILSEHTGLPVRLGNDANAAALGEWRFGSGRGCQNFIYVTISTGIGGGVITEGQLLLGRKGIGGEVGHMTIQVDGPLCGCGNYGCWEIMASGTALGRFATAALAAETGAGRSSLIAELAGDGPVEGRHVAQAAERGDDLAQTIIRREGEMIGVGMVNLMHLYSPERIALGGGVSKSMALLEPHMRRVIAERAMQPYRDTIVDLAQLGDNVGVIGAAALMA